MYTVRGFSITPKTYCIKRGNKHVCVQDTKTSYAIGFSNGVIARNLMYGMSPDPLDAIILKRSESIDITKDVNSGLRDLAIPSEFQVDSLEIDMAARIFIKKRNKRMHGDVSTVPDSGFHISTIDTTEFLEYPLGNSIGVCLPLYIEDEDDSTYVLKTVLVEPTYCAPITKSFLKKMLGP